MLTTGPSLHLTWAELQCHDAECTPYPGHWLDRAQALAAEFEAIRAACGGKPIKVISAYRTPAHNQGVGGVGKSQHTEGRALDVAPPEGMSLQTFHRIVLEQALLRGIIRGVGVYPGDGHVHFDLRLSDHLAQWSS